jgi:hypothetical protein
MKKVEVKKLVSESEIIQMALRYLTVYGLDFSHVQLNNSAEHYSPFWMVVVTKQPESSLNDVVTR